MRLMCGLGIVLVDTRSCNPESRGPLNRERLVRSFSSASLDAAVRKRGYGTLKPSAGNRTRIALKPLTR